MLTAEQLQAIKERLTNVPDGWTISQGTKLIEQLSFDGIALIAEVERLRAVLDASEKHLMVAERHLRDFKKFEFEERTEKERLREALEDIATRDYSLLEMLEIADKALGVDL